MSKLTMLMSISLAYALNSRLKAAGTLKLSGRKSWSELRTKLSGASNSGGGAPFRLVAGLLIFAMILDCLFEGVKIKK